MGIKESFKKVDAFEPVKFMRLNIVKFLENISFNENFIKSVLKFMDNKKQYVLFNLFKEIKNSNKRK